MATPRKKRGVGVAPTPHAQPVEGLTWASQAVPGRTEWILPGVIPGSAITVVEGRKSVGKSTVLAAIAAAWTGGPSIPGWTGPTDGRVIWVASEDAWDSVVVPRLNAAAANLDRVGRLLLPVQGGQPRRPRIPEDLKFIEDAVRDSGARLLVLDPYVSLAPPGLDVRVEQHARTYLEPLGDICARCNATALLSRHLRKGQGGDAREAGLGSVAVANVARSVLRCDEHPTAKGDHVLAVVACNYGRRKTTQGYRLKSGIGDYPYVEWLGDVQVDADQIAEGRGSTAERDEWQDAHRLLRSLIGNSWIQVVQIQGEAERAGVGQRMLRRAKSDLHIRTRRTQFNGVGSWEWGPPADGWPNDLEILPCEGGAHAEGGALGALAPQRAIHADRKSVV